MKQELIRWLCCPERRKDLKPGANAINLQLERAGPVRHRDFADTEFVSRHLASLAGVMEA